MNHALVNQLAMNPSRNFSTYSALPTRQELLREEVMAEMYGGINPILFGILVGIAVNIITNPTGIPENVRWYLDRGNDAVDAIAGDFISGMADGLSNF